MYKSGTIPQRVRLECSQLDRIKKTGTRLNRLVNEALFAYIKEVHHDEMYPPIAFYVVRPTEKTRLVSLKLRRDLVDDMAMNCVVKSTVIREAIENYLNTIEQ